MTSHLLLLAADAAAPAGDASNAFTKITDTFGINLPAVLAQMLNFGIVAFVIWYFGLRRIIATIDERQKKIESGLKYADDMKAKLEAAQQESAAIIKKSSVEAGRIVDEARKTAKDFLDKQTQEASGVANELLAKAQQAIELEHKKMLAEARGEIARLVVVTTERVLAKRLSDADRAGYNEAAARELAEV
jgi:F-type H+-transporting ATPase subunit b